MHRQAAYLFVAVAMTASTGSAFAGDALHQKRTPAEKLCDSYGAGFVPAGAPGNCVKVQERLRVEPQGRRALSPLDSASAFAPLPMQDDGAMPAHLRLNGGFGESGLR